MWNRLRYLITVAVGVYAVAELLGWWLAGMTLQGWLELAGHYVVFLAIALAWVIADRRACAMPPTEGPEADYRDPPATT